MDYSFHGYIFRLLILIFQVFCKFQGGHGENHNPALLCDAAIRSKTRTPNSETDPGNINRRRSDLAQSYFFGTIHVPYSKVWDFVSQATKQAFEEADHVIFELDLTNSKTVQALSSCQLLPDGLDLSSLLPGDLYVRLKKHLDYTENMMPLWMSADQKGRGLSENYLFNAITNNWHRKRPVWVMLMLNSLTESDVKSRGVPVLDHYLAQEAVRLQKHTGAVERVEEQCLPLNSMNLSQVIFALNHSLQQHETIRAGNLSDPSTTSTEDLVYHYNCGDLDSVIFKRDSAQVTPVGWKGEDDVGEAIDEYFRVELIQKRNRRMAKRVVELLETYPKRKFFFAFGAGHFLGNHSVIAYMEEMGYRINHLSADHQIKSSNRNSNRRKYRQRNPVLQSDSPGMSFSAMAIWQTNEQLLQDTDKLLANLRSDYVDDRAYERQRKRKQPRINPDTGQLGRRWTSTKSPNKNFNELWIARSTTTTPQPTYLDNAVTSGKDGSGTKIKLSTWANATTGFRSNNHWMLLEMFSLLIFFGLF